MASPSSLRWSISDRSWDEMNATDRERLLADLLPLLAACGMAKASADRSSPLTDLQLECRSIVCDEVRRRDVRDGVFHRASQPAPGMRRTDCLVQRDSRLDGPRGL